MRRSVLCNKGSFVHFYVKEIKMEKVAEVSFHHLAKPVLFY